MQSTASTGVKTVFMALALASFGCADDDDKGDGDTDGGSLTAEQVAPVLENYAAMVESNYDDAVATAEVLDEAIDTFIADPTEINLTAAREAWLDARDPYGRSEVYRFYGGPIDNEETGPEGQLNAWPMNEAHVDYVEGNPNAGIINDPTIDITKEMLIGLNEDGGEENIAVGYHAIEFLLWGQDMNADGPGNRPATDYVTDGSGTAANQDRRAQYLAIVSDLLVEDLTSVAEAWRSDAAYRTEFVALDPQTGLYDLLQGMAFLSAAELGGERMFVAYDTQDQEDEHSCFSDNTHRDIFNNALGVQNVYLGTYGNVSGPSLSDLVAAADPDLDQEVRDALETTMTAIEAIPVPFDQAIADPDGRDKVFAAIDALNVQADRIVAVASLFEINLNLE